MNIPLFPFFGNKDREISTIMNNLPVMTDIDTIIEPYCGSFSLIRHLLLLYPDKKYICNDNDKDLIDCYKAVQADDSCSELINFFQNFEIRNKQHYDEFKKEGSVRSFLFSHIVYSIRNGMYDKNKHKLNDRDIIRITHFNKAYKNVEFICGDASVIIDKYKNDKTCFMFLDPPFLMQCSFYKLPMLDSYIELLKNIADISAKILGVCGEHFLMTCFYEHYKIEIKFETHICYRGHKNNIHKNIYVANY